MAMHGLGLSDHNVPEGEKNNNNNNEMTSSKCDVVYGLVFE